MMHRLVNTHTHHILHLCLCVLGTNVFIMCIPVTTFLQIENRDSVKEEVHNHSARNRKISELPYSSDMYTIF